MLSVSADINLINASGRKSPESFRHLFSICHKSLFYFANELVNSRERAEEIVAESFSKLWLMEENLESYQTIRSFLYLTTRNACYTYLKGSGKLTEKELQEFYSKNNWEEDFVEQVIEAELMGCLTGLSEPRS